MRVRRSVVATKQSPHVESAPPHKTLLTTPFATVPHAFLQWTALIGILLVGAFLRLYQLEYKSLWVDEIGQVVAAQGGAFAAIRGAAKHVAAPPLDYLVTWLTLQIGNNEFILRYAPAAWSILAIPLLYALTRQLTRSVPVALVAAYLLALAPLIVRYAQEVRFYSLSVLLTLGVVHAFSRAWERNTRRAWLWFTLTLAAAFYAHYYIVFVAVALAAWVILSRALCGIMPSSSDSRQAWRGRAFPFAAAVLIAGLVALPWLVFAGRGEASAYLFSPPPLAELVADPIVGVNIDAEWRAALNVLGVIILPLLAMLGLLALWRTRRAASVLLVSLLGFGVVGVLAADYSLRYFYTPRQLLFLVPFYLILVAAGIVALCEFAFRSRRIWRTIAIVATLAAITLLLAPSLRGYYDWVKDDWRSAAQLLEDARAETVLTEPSTLGTYLTYYRPALANALRNPRTDRIWIVTMESSTPRALGALNAVRLDVSPTLNIYFAGTASERELLREVAAFDLPPQVLIYSDLLSRVNEFDPALARSLAAHGQQAVLRGKPPLLDSQANRLLRRLKRLKE